MRPGPLSGTSSLTIRATIGTELKQPSRACWRACWSMPGGSGSSHPIKKGRRYRYYVSAELITEAGTDRAQGRRIGAREIEEAVVRILIEGLTSPVKLVERFGTAGMVSDQIRKM